MKSFIITMALLVLTGCSIHSLTALDGTKVSIVRAGKHETKNLTAYKIAPDGSCLYVCVGEQKTESLADVIKEASKAAKLLVPK